MGGMHNLNTPEGRTNFLYEQVEPVIATWALLCPNGHHVFNPEKDPFVPILLLYYDKDDIRCAIALHDDNIVFNTISCENHSWKTPEEFHDEIYALLGKLVETR